MSEETFTFPDAPIEEPEEERSGFGSFRQVSSTSVKSNSISRSTPVKNLAQPPVPASLIDLETPSTSTEVRYCCFEIISIVRIVVCYLPGSIY